MWDKHEAGRLREGHPLFHEGMSELTMGRTGHGTGALGQIAMFVLGFICGVVAVLAILLVTWRGVGL